MSVVRSIARACLAAAVLAGCATRSSPVPLQADEGALTALAGEWSGEYSSAATGRSGSIVFKLTAGSDTAFGDVVMVPSGSAHPLTPAPKAGVEGGVVTHPTAQALTIRFVRVSGDSVSGALDPYQSPECGCALVTTFTGRVEKDRIHGTFVTHGEMHASAPQTGTWSVRRRG